MAIDSRDKRFSFLAFGKQVPYMMPNPDGTIDRSDVAMFMYLYPGISIQTGHPTMMRWGGVKFVPPGPAKIGGRTW